MGRAVWAGTDSGIIFQRYFTKNILRTRSNILRNLIVCLARFAFLSVVVVLTVAALAQRVPTEMMNGLKWRLIGPFRGGRVVAVAGIPGDSTTFYFGSVNGGIWKTTDAGVVWAPIFDGQPVASIGALAVAPSDSKIIYAGTGETDIRSDLSSGNGVYKSSDGGVTWNRMGLEDTRQISRIVIDPQNPAIVYVGALGHAYGPNPERGVYKSVDGGAHWDRVLDLGSEVGISDLAMATSAPSFLFAGTWNSHRAPWSTYAPIDGPGGGLYRSQDAGKTWLRLEGNGLPDGDWGRVGVDVTADGKRVYALISVRGQADKSGLYRSDDGGDHWALANADPRLTGRAWYFNRITIDPNNRDVIYVPNVALYRSEDGGNTISIIRGAPGGDDYHQLWIDPRNSASMVLGTDQGTTISLDRGQTWSSWYNQPTAQLYHVTTDNQFPYTVYGAQQDSGSAAVASRTNHGQITPRDWFPAGPSESGYLVVDPTDPDIVYLSGSFGTVARFNRKTELSQDVSPWPAIAFEAEINQRKYRAPWTPVLTLSPAEPKALYFGTQYVMKTVDGGLHWQRISPDLTGSLQESTKAEDGAAAGNAASNKDVKSSARAAQSSGSSAPTLEAAKGGGFGVIYTIAPSPINRDLMWAGSDTGLIHLTRDGGKNWKNVTPPGLSDWSKLSMIEASHSDPAVAYAAVDRSRLDDQTPYIYRTRDYGATWQRINDGITAPAFVRAIREDPGSKGLLFAGTQFGVYTSFDDGGHWQSLQLNLPATSVPDLNIHGDDLVIATHGRSFWILDNITPLRQALAASRAPGPWLYRPATAVRLDGDSFTGTPIPPEEPTAENPPNGAMIDYFLPHPAATVQIEVFDAQQNLVRRFSSEDQSDKNAAQHKILPIAERWFPRTEFIQKYAGAHRFVWDLAMGSSGGVNEEDSERNLAPPKTVPGIYQVRLTVDGKVQDQALEIIMDPRSPATPAILRQQFQLSRQIYDEGMQARRVIAEVVSVQKQLVDPKRLAIRDVEITSLLQRAQSDIARLLINKERRQDDPMPGLQEAFASLASALRAVESGDRVAPSQVIEVYKESSEQLKVRMGQWVQFKRATLMQLNEKLRGASIQPIAIGPN
jgi:photosystem II stability/assembly factor-like uncharacterized protein